ncbi:MAG: hypothetical protein R2712_09750 [Vicinamibacterales bacterium]
MRVVVAIGGELAGLDLGDELARGDGVALLHVQGGQSAAQLGRDDHVVRGDDAGEDEDRRARPVEVVPDSRAGKGEDQDETNGLAHGETNV